MNKNYEPYFERYTVVKVIQSKQREHQGHNRFQHKTCLGFIPINKELTPPRVCPVCHADCEKEVRLEETLKSEGAVLLDPLTKPIKVKEDLLIGGSDS